MEQTTDKITDKIRALPKDGTYFSLEFFPPKTPAGATNLRARLDRMASALRPLFVNVTWGAGGSTSSKSLELADICQRQLGLTTCLHLTCTNMSRRLVDRALRDARALGVRNVLALRGDPPRHDEYRRDDEDCDDWDFAWAADLVRYVREQHGDYFCVGVAAYPEGHWDAEQPDRQSCDFDLPHLVEKVRAGADFIMTQLFYDVAAWKHMVSTLRGHESGAFEDIPIIPGLMPVQSYQILSRTSKLSHAVVPAALQSRLDAVKGDDDAVKRVGVDILCEMISAMREMDAESGPRGFHFYTLNLEKVVTQIVERSQLIPSATPEGEANGEVNGEATDESAAVVVDESRAALAPPPKDRDTQERRRSSFRNGSPHNRVIVDRASSPASRQFSTRDDEAGVPALSSRAATLAISEGEGPLGREATWDDFPNGRWGDARSPAYGEIDGYGVSLHVSVPQAVKLWGRPASRADVSAVFRRHIVGELAAIPWTEEGLNPETRAIQTQLLALNARGWWTVASQPAVDGVRSSDPIFGWGPPAGYVFQKPFVEFFVPAADWKALRARLDALDDVTYFAADRAGAFIATDPASVNPVTWGSFRGKEIVTPTIIEAVSFRAWADEAFSLWTEWSRVYPPRSDAAKLLTDIRDGYWLVNVIHHRYVDKEALWDVLLAP